MYSSVEILYFFEENLGILEKCYYIDDDMSCLSLLKVKSVSFAGVKKAYIPCGVCQSCVSKSQMAWTFRLRAEWRGLLKRPEECHCAFCTLTYGTPKRGYARDMRPRMPRFVMLVLMNIVLKSLCIVLISVIVDNY